MNDPRLPVRSRTLILPRCPEARGNIDFDLNIDPKVLRTLSKVLRTLSKALRNLGATLAQPVRIASAHHQTVFEPPFMTGIGPAIGVMSADSGTRWLPEPRTFGSKSGRVLCRPRDQRLATSCNPSVGVQMVSDLCRRVEPSVD